MNTMPLNLTAGQRASLVRFEQLHAAWREAADARPGPDWLQQLTAAEQLHREAMQLMREEPL